MSGLISSGRCLMVKSLLKIKDDWTQRLMVPGVWSPSMQEVTFLGGRDLLPEFSAIILCVI